MTQPVAPSASSRRLLVERYLRKCVVTSAGRPVFAKLEVMRDLDLLAELADALAPDVDPETDAVCLLANSGLPFGVFLARKLHKPLYCYSKSGWQQRGTGQVQPVRPPLPAGTRIVLADSHVREAYTASKAEEELVKLDVQVKGIVVPFDFDELHRYQVQSPIIALGRMSEYRDVLQSIMEIMGYYGSVDDYLHNADFWQYARLEPLKSTDVFQESRSLRSLLPRPQWHRPRVHYISSNVRTRVDRHLPTDPYGVWHLFTDPSLVNDVVVATDTRLQLSRYDILIGLGTPGSLLVLNLAYGTSFRGEVALLIPELGFAPEPREWKDKRVLLCQDTLTSSAYPLEVIEAVRQHGAHVDALLVIRTVTRRSRWFPSISRLPAVLDLAAAGVRVFALC